MIARWIHRTSDRVASWSPRTKWIVTFAVLAVAFALPCRGLLRNQGPPMEEGFMLVFPERVLHGDFPNKDFLHLYGPGSLWVLAGWMKVLGVTLTSERLFALLQQIGVVGGVYWLARAWGRRLALVLRAPRRCCSSSRRSVSPRWPGSAASRSVCSGWDSPSPAAAGSRAIPHSRSASRSSAASSAPARSCSGSTSSWPWCSVRSPRPPASAPRSRSGTRSVSASACSPYIVQLATAGPYNTFKGMVLDPVVYLRGGRRLPIPPSWDHLDGFLQRSGRDPTAEVAAAPLLLVAAAVHLVLLHDRGRDRAADHRPHRGQAGSAAPPGPRAVRRRACSGSG